VKFELVGPHPRLYQPGNGQGFETLLHLVRIVVADLLNERKPSGGDVRNLGEPVD